MAACKLGALEGADLDLTGAAAVLSARLRKAGHDIGPTTIKDHRAERCSCTRTARIVAGTARILVVDIERLPGFALVPFWTLGDYKNRRIHADHVTDWPRTICAAWRWYGDKRVHFASEWGEGGRDAMLRTIWDAYDNADIVVGHNVGPFDTKKLRSEWKLAGLPAPSTHKTVDTLAVARAQFGFESNTLDSLCKRFGLGGKTDKYDAQVASAAVAGDKAAQRKLRLYNCGDVEQTEALYDALRGWIPNHPHVGVFGKELRCNQCGSDQLTRLQSTYQAVVLDYPAYRCDNCSSLIRGQWEKARRADTRGVS
jgi:hypothetical protein